MLRLLLRLRRLGGAGAISNAREELVASHARVVTARAACSRVQTIDNARAAASLLARPHSWPPATPATPAEQPGTRRAA
ncbi:MAG: hypothetical protein WKF43_04175 [Acidimicrobiales bacterium]